MAGPEEGYRLDVRYSDGTKPWDMKFSLVDSSVQQAMAEPHMGHSQQRHAGKKNKMKAESSAAESDKKKAETSDAESDTRSDAESDSSSDVESDTSSDAESDLSSEDESDTSSDAEPDTESAQTMIARKLRRSLLANVGAAGDDDHHEKTEKTSSKSTHLTGCYALVLCSPAL